MPIHRETELRLTERIVRVEEELKSTRELMLQGFVAMDKRSEQMGKRFGDNARQLSRWMATITILISLIGLMGAWGVFTA